MWYMTDAERCALSALLISHKPACAIEVGVFKAGSLAVVAAHSNQVYAVDIDPECARLYGPQFPNVEFITGPSSETLPRLLDQLQDSEEALEFVLIDGDHSEACVRGDIEAVLRYRPRRPLYIVMHDSFNPEVRRGIRHAAWAANPHVHAVELDFVVGRLAGPDFPDAYLEMWNGLALAVLLPDQRIDKLAVHETDALMFKAALGRSVYRYQRWWNPGWSLPRLGGRLRHGLTTLGRNHAPGLYAALKRMRDRSTL